MSSFKPFKSSGISFGDDVGIFPTEDGQLVFTDNYVRNTLQKEHLSLREIYLKSNGVFNRDGRLYFKDSTVNREISLKELVDASNDSRDNFNSGNLWWMGRTSTDHSKCANIPLEDDPSGDNVLWSIDKFLTDFVNINACDNRQNVTKNTRNEDGDWLWWDVQGMEIVVPPITDPYKLALIFSKLYITLRNSGEPIVFRLYDATSRTELTRTSVLQANEGNITIPVTLNYFGPLTLSNRARMSYNLKNDIIDCNESDEDCGCNDINCADEDPSCAIPSSSANIEIFDQGSHLIKLQFFVDNFNDNYWDRILGHMSDNEYYTESNIEVAVFDSALDRRLTKQHGTAIMENTTETEVVFKHPLINNNYSISLCSNRNVNCWWENKTEVGFTIKSELPIDGRIDWIINKIGV